MPSREYMEQMLRGAEEETAEEAAVEVDPTSFRDEVATEEEEAPVEEEELEEVEEEEEEGETAPEEEQETEGEQPTEEATHEDEFYLGRYRNREEAERGWLEKEQMISRQGDELAQLRQQMAELTGYVQGAVSQQGADGDFDEWADAYIEGGRAIEGANEALQASLEQGDPSYVDAYVERWKEQEPFEAARFALNVDMIRASAYQAQQEAQQPPPLQQTINNAWLEVAETDPDLRDPETAKGVGAILKNNPALRATALSGDPELVRSAIAIARDGYKMQIARTAGSGTPRKVRSSDAQRLRQDKLDATVTTGDSAPERGTGSTPEVPPELQDMLSRIQAGEGGFPRLRE